MCCSGSEAGAVGAVALFVVALCGLTLKKAWERWSQHTNTNVLILYFKGKNKIKWAERKLCLIYVQ